MKKKTRALEKVEHICGKAKKRLTNLPLSKSGMSAVSKILCCLFGS
jgi:hypothetical protein